MATDPQETRSLGRRFWTLWSAFGVSNLGDGLSFVGYPLLAVELTDDALLVAVVAAARFLPFITIGLPAGVLIDRFDRRRIAMYAQVARSSALLVVVAAIVGGWDSITVLTVTAFAVGVGEVMTDSGLPAVVRDVVRTDQLEVANSRLRANETVANLFIGPPVGAILFEFSNSAPFLGAAILYVVSIVILGALPGDFRPRVVDTDGFVVQMKRGLQYVWNHPVLRPLAFAVAAFSFAGSAHTAMFVVLATERIGLSGVQFGLLLAVGSVASVVMSFFVAWLVKRTSHGRSMQLSVVTFTVHAFLFAGFTAIPIVVAAALIGGISGPTWNVVSATVRQRLVDDQIFGRMMTAYLLIAWSIQPLGTVAGGAIAERFGVEWVYVMSGAIVGSLFVFARPLFSRVDAALAVSNGTK